MKYIKHVISSLIIILLCIYYGRVFYVYYFPAKELKIYHTVQHHDSILRVAYIGDSWADRHQHLSHNCRIANMLNTCLTKPAKVSSFGVSGLKSKEIYQALYKLDSFKNFLEEGYDYCFISAGINDCNEKMSLTYYKESMNCIIRFFLANHIHPIILEIPDYNIHNEYERQKANIKIIRNISFLINKTPLDCKQQYRDALDELIQAHGYKDKVSIIRYKTWNNNYKNDLKELYTNDQLHLNENGYSKLDSVIAKEIIRLNTYHKNNNSYPKI